MYICSPLAYTHVEPQVPVDEDMTFGKFLFTAVTGKNCYYKRTVNKPELLYILYYVQSRVTPKKQVAGANSSRENG